MEKNRRLKFSFFFFLYLDHVFSNSSIRAGIVSQSALRASIYSSRRYSRLPAFMIPMRRSNSVGIFPLPERALRTKGWFKRIIYLRPWWSWRPAWPAARPRRSWSPPLVSWTCDVFSADYGSPGNGPGRWSTCALCSPNTRARRMSRTRCTTPRRTASTLKTRWRARVRPKCRKSRILLRPILSTIYYSEVE